MPATNHRKDALRVDFHSMYNEVQFLMIFLFSFLLRSTSAPPFFLHETNKIVSRNVSRPHLYDDDVVQVARKLAMVEADLERAEERAEAGES